jgi:histidine ammonia-lyase
MTVVVNTRADFTLENFRRVAVDGEGVAIGDEARQVMSEARAHFNALTVAWADLALIAERHVTALHTPSVSELPPLLALPGAPGSDTNLFGWVAGGFVEGARAAAAPSLLPASVNDSRDDVSVPTFLAYGKERRGAACLDGALAILSLVASQALFVAGRQPAPPLREYLDGVRSVFRPVDGPRRQLGAEAGRLADVLSSAALSGRLTFA